MALSDSSHASWAAVAAIVVSVGILVGGPVACTMHEATRITEMVKAGADPQAASCAVSPNNRVCDVVAARPAKP